MSLFIFDFGAIIDPQDDLPGGELSVLSYSTFGQSIGSGY